MTSDTSSNRFRGSRNPKVPYRIQRRDSGYSGGTNYRDDSYHSRRGDSLDLDREDIMEERYEDTEGEYLDYGAIDYGAGEYIPEYDDEYGYTPGHVHQPYSESEHRYAHERWTRSRYGAGSAIPEYWTDRDGEYDSGLQAQYPEQGPWDDSEPPGGYYYPGDYYVPAPGYYRERYLPEEDSLRKLYLRMFRNIEYNVKVPVMQLIATGALFFIFILNYMINIEYVQALGNFSPWVDIQPPAVAAILGAVFGIFLYLFPTLDRDIKRTVLIGTIILLIFFFAGPALLTGLSTQSYSAVGEAFATTIIEFLKLAAVLVYWAPIFLGIYGIWSRNSFYVGASAMFLFLIIIVLDIYLFYEGLPIDKIRDNWPVYVIFSVILFCYIEMSDSAITFANFTSVTNQEEIDPEYYDHLDRILQKYFVYFILFIIFLLILTWITLNFNEVLRALGSIQAAESMELASIYGTIIALIIIAMIILFIGLFIRYEESFRKVYRRMIKPRPSIRAYRSESASPQAESRRDTDFELYRNQPTRVRKWQE